jgi:hypothetical protein
MAVACHIPNSIACDRVGLAVWLRHPALSISATIAGAPLQLNNPDWSGPARHGRRRMFAGFLHPAWIGTNRERSYRVIVLMTVPFAERKICFW